MDVVLIELNVEYVGLAVKRCRLFAKGERKNGKGTE